MSKKYIVRATLLISITLFTLGIAAPNPASAWQTNIPLNQTLVLEGGESTNPREYDPATTHSSNNKRVFSGLVSYDPQLNLTPDLAERWEISSDGTIYTFYLRDNAKFHNGRAVTAQDVI